MIDVAKYADVVREESRLRAKLHWIAVAVYKAKITGCVDKALLDEIERMALEGLEGDK